MDAALLELTRRGLLHPEPADGPDDAYSIHHVLLRDVAYASLPKAVRAVLHERAAAWLDRDGPGPDEIVGWHLEQAYRYRSELRPGDPELPRLAEAAGSRLGAAGMRATKSSDTSAVSLLGRAADLLPDGTLRADLLLELGAWLRTVSDMNGSKRALDEALRIAGSAEDGPRVARARIDLAWAASAMETRRPVSDLGALIEELRPVLEAAGDDRGLQRAWQFLASVHIYGLQLSKAAEAARQAAVHARAAGWWPPRQPVLMLGLALVHGPTPVPIALAELNELLAEHEASRSTWAVAATSCASLRAMAAEHAAAAGLMTRAHSILEDTDDRLALRTFWTPQRLVQLRLEGDVALARELVTRWVVDLRHEGNDAFLSTALAQLADLVVEDEPEHARALLDEATARASAQDLIVQALLRSVSAKRCAVSGNAGVAAELAAESVAILAQTDSLCDRARIAIAAARALDLSGDETGVARSLGEARDLYAKKGNVTALDTLERDGTRAVT